ncbi:hypothetical protein ASD99_11845 [Mesorhizobium sp. Root695]|jgi:hypothetical protein|nr:hypothetical protein ASD99_11845 [Mesorhizobium sp. Root695]
MFRCLARSSDGLVNCLHIGLGAYLPRRQKQTAGWVRSHHAPSETDAVRHIALCKSDRPFFDLPQVFWLALGKAGTKVIRGSYPTKG